MSATGNAVSKTTVVVIGAGHCGLSISRCLASQKIDHVILERGEIANSWKKERWESLRLLTPNWQTQLPGYAYSGDDPDGFMTVQEVVQFIEGYAKEIEPPIKTNTEVTRVSHDGDVYTIETTQGTWQSKVLVLASGACNLPVVPKWAEDSSLASTTSLHSFDYKSPDQLPMGRVLVVGASATGLQVAAELQKSGRQVTLAVGEHVRLPRVYRGRDIQWWLDSAGILDVRFDEVDDVIRARNTPSPQLVGTPERLSLDMNYLTDMGVQLVGRLGSIGNGKLHFSGSLKNNCAHADLKMERVLRSLDDWADENGHGSAPKDWVFEPTRVESSPPLHLPLGEDGIQSIFWATGYRPDYSWLDLPVLDRKGYIRHNGGVAEMAGLYAMGLTFLRRRKSSFIHGAGDDAEDLTSHIAEYLGVSR